MHSAEEPPLQLKSPIKAPKEAQKGKLERGLETNSQKGSFPDALQQPKLSSRAGGSSILTLAGDCILEPFWEAFWRQFGAKLANYTHFGQLWPDFGPLRAVKFKMQIRLDKKCSFGQATVGYCRKGRRQRAGHRSLDRLALDSSGKEFHTADISKLMRRISKTPTACRRRPPTISGIEASF